jgi:hypothetical protein
MGYQTMLDIASRGTVPHCEFLTPTLTRESAQLTLELRVMLRSGPICDRWCVELELDPARWRTEQIGSNAKTLSESRVAFQGAEPLFPNRPTFVSDRHQIVLFPASGPLPGALNVQPTDSLKMTLFAESSQPLSQTWRMSELKPRQG